MIVVKYSVILLIVILIELFDVTAFISEIGCEIRGKEGSVWAFSEKKVGRGLASDLKCVLGSV